MYRATVSIMSTVKIIQSGCIQTHIDQHGRLVKYRLTLPVPVKLYEFTVQYPVLYNNISSRSNKCFYIRVSQSFDDLLNMQAQAQVWISKLKMDAERRKQLYLLSKMSMQLKAAVTAEDPLPF